MIRMTRISMTAQDLAHRANERRCYGGILDYNTYAPGLGLVPGRGLSKGVAVGHSCPVWGDQGLGGLAYRRLLIAPVCGRVVVI